MLVAYEMNGAPLPVQHGFPARVVVPGWYGMGNVKWLRRITAATEAFDGFQNRAYRLRQEVGEEGEPITRIEPRALLEPPGFPDFMTRTRVVRPGPTSLARPRLVGLGTGRAGRGQRRRRYDVARGRARRRPRSLGLAGLHRPVGRRARRAPAAGPRP